MVPWTRNDRRYRSSSAIVGGVWGEVHFAHKARLAGDRQLAQYETRTAEANARAEEAKRDADKIRLELTEFRERRLSIRTKLGVFRPKFDMGIGDHNDAEQYEFLFELFTLLSNLWVFKDWEGGPIAFVGPLGGIGAVPVNNVSIQVHPEYADSLTIAAKALEGALNAIGIAATFEPLKIPQNRNGDAIHVLIGRKL